jgi:predicted transcriptional regulator
MNKKIEKIFKDNKIKVYKVNPILNVISNGTDILYFKDKNGNLVGKIDFTIKKISGIFETFKSTNKTKEYPKDLWFRLNHLHEQISDTYKHFNNKKKAELFESYNIDSPADYADHFFNSSDLLDFYNGR